MYSDIESLQLSAGVHEFRFGRFHRLLSKRFPFAIHYQLATSEIRVIAVLDSRRNPAWLRQQVTKRVRR